MMTKEQSLNQPSLAMLISSILVLMNWLACERTGIIILIEETDRSKAGGEEEAAPSELRGWEVCIYVHIYICVCVWGGARVWSGGSVRRAFRHDRAISRPSETQCGSFHVGLSNTSNCAVKPLFSVLLRKVCQLAESERRRGAREGVRGKERGAIMEE